MIMCETSLGIIFWRNSNHSASSEISLSWGWRMQGRPCLT